MSGARNIRVLAACFGVTGLMVGASYAAVPLYQLFCQVTGFGGTTQAAEIAPERALARDVTVYFDSNVAPGLTWRFEPVQRSQTLKIGEPGLAYFRATNISSRPLTGTATFNVTPHKAGPYFAKLECFCFTEQALQPGESMEMPVQYFIDPAMAEEADLDDITAVTLSYTFFRQGAES